ncbi:MerR family transcriptional regulator [uncultured Jannaschia sp.]|uniref:MerR family transcriptional regulator n=1 Tax=uncultured Jannaschia sp. TaxID=293347 RepID=UPI0026092BC8|nr:MerR family transcriptional regulator [uncultured Jannaschia sp.]
MARAPEKSEGAFRTIREVADWLGVPTHVLRFWESKFAQIEPVKGAGGRRYYRPEDMRLLGGIKVLLHDEGLPIRGVVQKIDEEGVDAVMVRSPSLDRSESVPKPRRVIRSDDMAEASRVVSIDRARENAVGGGPGREAPPEPELPEDLPFPSDPSPTQPDMPDDDDTVVPPQPADRPVPEPSDMPGQPDPPKTRSDDWSDPAGANSAESADPETDALEPGAFHEPEELPDSSSENGLHDPEEVDMEMNDAPASDDDESAGPMPEPEDAFAEPALAFTIPEPLEPETAESAAAEGPPEPGPTFEELFPSEPASEDADVAPAPVFGTSLFDTQAVSAGTPAIRLTPVNRRALRRVVRKLRGLIEEVEADLNEGADG